MENKEIDFSKFKFSLDLSKTNYQLDALQSELLRFYLRADRKFRMAFSINYTPQFFNFIKDKARLNEPISLSVCGQTRTGKSYSAISLCQYHQLQYKRLFTIDYICANSMEFLEKLQQFPKEKLLNRIFLIDEEKQAIFGYGSLAKKVKIQDVTNISAINNISTIMLTPFGWQNQHANYGLRTFGRCFDTKSVRFMLYNLQESGRGGTLPMGNIYLPIFTAFMPKEYGELLEKQYLEKKHEWVDMEREGKMDTMGLLKKNLAKTFIKDKQFLQLSKKNERMTYIATKLGSEWSVGESKEILQIALMMLNGIKFD